MASSTTKPIAIVNAMSEMLSMLKLSAYIAANEPSSANGIVMLGMIVAAGLAWNHWIGFLISLVLFGIGTAIRVRSEEKLLREQFGAAFEDYKRNVPAVVPIKL